MLKTRIIGVIILKCGHVVQSIGFNKYLPVGRLDITVEYLNRWGIDEIVILDIDASLNGQSPDITRIKNVTGSLQTPLSVGGGVTNVADMESLISSGADKLVLNTAFLKDPKIVTSGAKQFGSQCMIVSLDAKLNGGDYSIFSKTTNRHGSNLIDAVKRAEDCGAGEIFLNSVDNDGVKQGYDLKLFDQVNKAVSIPVIFCGGAGHAWHMRDAINAGAKAVAAGNFFHFTELSVIATKQILKRSDINVRLDSYSDYKNAEVDSESGRITRMDESVLEDMRFEYVPEELI